MNDLLIPVSDDEFKNKIDIRFNNILDGFDSFENFTIAANKIDDGENKLIKFIERVFEENNYEAYIDFYTSKLTEEDKKRLLALIPDEDNNILKSHLNSNNHTGVFYKLHNKDFIPFLARLNTREVFFVTFYFTNRPITIWGNYNLKFPCFVNSKEDFKFYHNLSKSFGFSIELSNKFR